MSKRGYTSEHLRAIKKFDEIEKKFDEIEKFNDKFHKLMEQLSEAIENSHYKRANQIGFELVKLVKEQGKLIELLVVSKNLSE